MRVSHFLYTMLTMAVFLAPARAEPATGEGTPQSPAIINSQTAKPAGLIVVLPGATPPVAAPSMPAPAAAVPDAPAPQAATETPAANFVSTGASTEAAAPSSSGESTPAAASADPAAATTAPVEAAAPAEPPPPPEPTLVINVNLSTQRMTISENGAAKYTWPISSAAPGYSTPTGTFKPSWMSKMWYSRQYDMSPMPHSIFFSGGTAIHATQAIRYLGRPASHGCVRLAPSNAAKLFKMVGSHGKSMTKIVVHGSPRYQVTSRSYGSRSYGYGYGQPQRRRPASYYSTYGAPPSYYVPSPKRRYGYVPAKPRRYVARGMFSPY